MKKKSNKKNVDKWEYMIMPIYHDMDKTKKFDSSAEETVEWNSGVSLQEWAMNRFGKKGWELVSVLALEGDDFKCIFKRKLLK